VLGCRRSPKKGDIWDLFEGLVSIPKLVVQSRFTLEALFTRGEEVRRHLRQRGPDGRWRKVERRLLEVAGSKVFRNPADFLELVPGELSAPFTTQDLADATGRSLWQAQQMAYCLREMGAFEAVGWRGRAILHVRNRGARQNPVTG
jgi:hypothetical protein